MEELGDKLTELVEEAKTNGDINALSYLNRAKLMIMHTQLGLHASPEQANTINLLIKVLQKGYIKPVSEFYITIGSDRICYRPVPYPEWTVYLWTIHNIDIIEIDAKKIENKLCPIITSGTNLELNLRIALPTVISHIRFSNLYLYCCSIFRQYGWDEVAWILQGTTYKTYKENMEKLKIIFSEVHGFHTFRYPVTIIDKKEDSIDKYIDDLKTKINLEDIS